MTAPRIALLWHRAEDVPKARRARLDGVFRALTAAGAVAEPTVYDDDVADDVRARLSGVDGVLVWVNPITAGRDRRVLDAVLRDVASAGVWVSAHPDVIDILGTKEVLHRTRALGGGSDVRLYRDVAMLRAELPSRLAGAPRVLKRARGNAGIGVWKVALALPHATATLASVVRVEHAHDGTTEEVRLADFLERLTPYLDGGGCIIEQPFFARVAEGMVRCYLSGARVVGFAEHLPRGLVSSAEARTDRVDERPALGVDKIMHDEHAAAFRALRSALESDWIPAMQLVLALDAADLPAIWDADFLRGTPTARDADAWTLCEINVSSVSPFPDAAAPAIAATTVARVAQRRAAARG